MSQSIYEKIALAASALANSGRKPTCAAIRHELGNCGSMTTISKHLKVWRVVRQRLESGHGVLPVATAAAIKQALEQRQMEHLESSAAAELSAARELVAATRQQIEHAEKQLKLAQQQLADERSAAARNAQELQQLSINLAAARQEAAQLRKELETARVTANIALGAAQKQIRTLNETCHQLQAEQSAPVENRQFLAGIVSLISGKSK